jgi:hypothetical protein
VQFDVVPDSKERCPMTKRQLTSATLLAVGMALAPSPGAAQTGAETFSATATIKTVAAGATATAPVRIALERKMPVAEADKYAAAFKSGGAAALRKALTGVARLGSVTLGAAKPVPILIAFERPIGSGRLITIVTDTPLLFVGASLPGAKAKEGYEFGLIDLEVDAPGNGSGTVSPAAKIGLNPQGAFVVTDYSQELVRLTNVARAK